MNNVSIQDHLIILKSTLSANVPWRIHILKAALDGKSIQLSRKTKEEWDDLISPKDHVYNFDTFRYRIKPDVEIFHQYVVKTPDGVNPCRVFITVELFKSEEDCLKEYSGHEVIKRLDETRVEVTI